MYLQDAMPAFVQCAFWPVTMLCTSFTKAAVEKDIVQSFACHVYEHGPNLHSEITGLKINCLCSKTASQFVGKAMDYEKNKSMSNVRLIYMAQLVVAVCSIALKCAANSAYIAHFNSDDDGF